MGKTVNNSKTEDNTVHPETEIDHAFTDELLQKIEILTKDKAELVQELEEAKTNEISAKKQLEASRQTNLIGKIGIENAKSIGEKLFTLPYCPRSGSGTIKDLTFDILALA